MEDFEGTKELSIYDCSTGDPLMKIQIEATDTFAKLKDKIAKEHGYGPEDQTFFVGHDTTAPASEIVGVQVDVIVLDEWEVKDAMDYKLFLDIPKAADTVSVDADQILVVSKANNKMTVRPLHTAAGPVKFQCVNNTLNVLLESNGRTHSVLQYKKEDPGSFYIKQQDRGFKVFFVPTNGALPSDGTEPKEEDYDCLEGERKELTEALTWSETFAIAAKYTGRVAVTVAVLVALYGEQVTLSAAMALVAAQWEAAPNQPASEEEADAQLPPTQ